MLIKQLLVYLFVENILYQVFRDYAKYSAGGVIPRFDCVGLRDPGCGHRAGPRRHVQAPAELLRIRLIQLSGQDKRRNAGC